jgi:hypothetical protein
MPVLLKDELQASQSARSLGNFYRIRPYAGAPSKILHDL